MKLVKNLLKRLKDFDPKSLGDITKMFRLNAPARWLRAGATASPDFVFANIFRGHSISCCF